MTFHLTAAPSRKRPNLTPLIDVVFLLLIFFMLASSFDRDAPIQISSAGGTDAVNGPPRLIDILSDRLRLNGQLLSLDDIAPALDQIVTSRSDTIVLRPKREVDLQRMVDVMSALNELGFTGLVLLE